MNLPAFPTHKQRSHAILRWYLERPRFYQIFRLYRWLKEGAFFNEQEC